MSLLKSLLIFTKDETWMRCNFEVDNIYQINKAMHSTEYFLTVMISILVLYRVIAQYSVHSNIPLKLYNESMDLNNKI